MSTASTTCSEYNSLLITGEDPEPSIVPKGDHTNTKKLVIAGAALAAVGLAGGAVGGYFIVQGSQGSSLDNDSSDIVKMNAKKAAGKSSDSDNIFCPSYRDAVGVCLAEEDGMKVKFSKFDINDVSKMSKVKEDLVRTQDGHCDTGIYGDTFSRCTEYCCNEHGHAPAFYQNDEENVARAKCQLGCLVVVNDQCSDLTTSAATTTTTRESKHANTEWSSKEHYEWPSKATAQEVSTQMGPYFDCPNFICSFNKKERKDVCEFYCYENRFKLFGAYAVSVTSDDGKDGNDFNVNYFESIYDFPEIFGSKYLTNENTYFEESFWAAFYAEGTVEPCVDACMFSCDTFNKLRD